MNSKDISSGIVRAVIQITGICILIWLLLQIKTLLIYMLIAGIVSLIGLPINNFLTGRLKMRNILASSITITFLISILVSVFSLFVPLLIQQGENLSLLEVDPVSYTHLRAHEA